MGVCVVVGGGGGGGGGVGRGGGNEGGCGGQLTNDFYSYIPSGLLCPFQMNKSF